MKNDLINAFSNVSLVESEDLVSLNMGIKKRTGEKFVKATTADGKTFIKTLKKSGIQQDSIITIPSFSSKIERDSYILELSNDYVQEDIADMLGISQGTVSNILRKKR